MLPVHETIFRLLASAVVGTAIGFTRRHKPAGLRTFSLISMGSAIFTVISIDTAFQGADPTRIISQIVTGIGFLGLGVIWKQGMTKPTGLTTAAGIWVTAAIGVLIGLGMWTEALAATVLTMLIFYSKKPLERMKVED